VPDLENPEEDKSEVKSVAEIQNFKGSAKDPGALASNLAAAPPFKIKLALKLVAFIFSVITLSWFFEGAREIQNGLTLPAVAYLVAGGVFTVVLIGVQAFFIYAEEKSKDSRTRKIPLFDRVYDRWAAAKTQTKRATKLSSSDLEGDSTDRG